MQEFTPLQYLQIDIANLAGKDKLCWDDRLLWFKENEHDLLSFTEKADKPHQYYAAVLNYPQVAAGAVNYHPIALDATSSGTQILSCLICDIQAAAYCNVLNVGYRRDAYTDLYKLLSDEIGENPMITRENLKQAIMTSLYGSKQTPEELFGVYSVNFYKLMGRECPLIWQVNEFLTNNWNENVDRYGWVMPDNFYVDIKVHNQREINFKFCGSDFTSTVQVNAPNKYGRAYSANLTHSVDSLVVREITALAMHNPKQIAKIRALLDGKYINEAINEKDNELVEILANRAKATDFLSARVLDHLNSENIKLVNEQDLRDLLALVPAKPFECLVVHDSFHVLPNYGNDIRKLYIAQLSKIAKSRLLQFILDQMPVPKITVYKGDPNMWKDILDSEYALS